MDLNQPSDKASEAAESFASADARDPEQYPQRLAVRTKGSILLVTTRDIQWIQSMSGHVLLHCKDVQHRVRLNIARLVNLLDPAQFVRIHRSTIVNVDCIRELRPWPTGEYIVMLRNGKELTLSRGYRAQVLRWIQGSVA